jgi:hypothetical protein
MKTIVVSTKFGEIEGVPLIRWKEIAPYWAKITKAFFEILTENDFRPYCATKKRPNGFVAQSYYWKKSDKNPKKFPLMEARRFLSKLVEHDDFRDAIREFNSKEGVEWLGSENTHILGGYVCSFFYALKPVLRTVQRGGMEVLKPRI